MEKAAETQKQISVAIKFLRGEEMRKLDKQMKTAFLLKKGLNQEQIN